MKSLSQLTSSEPGGQGVPEVAPSLPSGGTDPQQRRSRRGVRLVVVAVLALAALLISIVVKDDGRGTPVVFVEQMIDGVRFGLILAIAALGISLIYSTSGYFNFAYGDMIAFSAIATYFLNVGGLGWPVLLAGLAAVIMTGLLGGALEEGFFRPLQNAGSKMVGLIVASLGLSLVLRYLLLAVYGAERKPYDDFVIVPRLTIGGVGMSYLAIATIVFCTVLLVLFGLALKYTRIGQATRAIANDPFLAETAGIDVRRVRLAVAVTGSALAGVAGVLQGVSDQVNWDIGLNMLLLIFAALILGGIGTSFGAIVGGVIIGISIQTSVMVIPSDLKYALAMAILIVVLLVRPQGIFGRADRVA